MKVGVDSSVVVAAVHANHPRHALSAHWLIRALAEDRLVIAHHSVLEAYAVLTRLPGEWRVTPSEARDLLAATVQKNMEIAAYQSDGIFALVESLVVSSVMGGRSYDAFVLHILQSAGAEAVATFNPSRFRGLDDRVRIIDPAEV